MNLRYMRLIIARLCAHLNIRILSIQLRVLRDQLRIRGVHDGAHCMCTFRVNS